MTEPSCYRYQLLQGGERGFYLDPPSQEEFYFVTNVLFVGLNLQLKHSKYILLVWGSMFRHSRTTDLYLSY